MFSITTMASSTTKPVAMVSAIRVRLLMLKPARYMPAKVPTSDSGMAMLGMSVARTAQEQEDHRHHQRDGQQQLVAHAVDRGANGERAVAQHLELDGGRQLAASCGSKAWMRSTVAMTLAPGWRCTFTIRAGVIGPGRELGVLGPVTTCRDVLQAQRSAIAIAQYQLAVLLGAAQLVVGVQGRGAQGPSTLPLGVLTLALTMAVRTSFEIEAVGGQARGFNCTRTAGF
jgi:hypothetical protein